MFKKNKAPNPNFCIAPWTHTFISPQSERRLCCASREQPQFLQQYLDKREGAKESEYNPISLAEHWNSDHMRSVRRRMLAGERLPECEVCNEQSLSLYTYRQYFTEKMFPDLIDAAIKSTSADGSTSMPVISFDYRLNNSCNFKCRMCGEQLSSSWEQEKRQHHAWSESKDKWMLPELKKQMIQFQKQVMEPEFQQALASGEVREIYWVGGEPLLWPQHWQSMQMLVDNNYAKNIYLRYNTNLSKVEHQGVRLFRDLLPNFSDYNICASLDGVGAIGEFIRTGLDWQNWQQNFYEGLECSRGRGEDALALDLTLTLPGLFGLKEYFDFAIEHDVKVYTKVIYAFDASILLSPLALPHRLLDPLLDDLLTILEPKATSKTQSIIDTLRSLKSRPSFCDTYSDYKAGFQRGRSWLQKLADWRGDGIAGQAVTLESIYEQRPEILAWWRQGYE